MLSERKIERINRNIDAFLAKSPTKALHLVQNTEPFSRRVSPYAELMEEIESFLNVNLISLGDFLSNSPGKALNYYDKTENFIQEIEKKRFELKRDFGGPEIDLLLGKLKHLRKWVQQKL